MHHFLHQRNFTFIIIIFFFSLRSLHHPILTTVNSFFRISFYLTGIRTQRERQTVFSPSSQKWRGSSQRWQTSCELYTGMCQSDFLLVFRQRPTLCVLCTVRTMRMFWRMDRSWWSSASHVVWGYGDCCICCCICWWWWVKIMNSFWRWLTNWLPLCSSERLL